MKARSNVYLNILKTGLHELLTNGNRRKGSLRIETKQIAVKKHVRKKMFLDFKASCITTDVADWLSCI